MISKDGVKTVPPSTKGVKDVNFRSLRMVDGSDDGQERNKMTRAESKSRSLPIRRGNDISNKKADSKMSIRGLRDIKCVQDIWGWAGGSGGDVDDDRGQQKQDGQD